jgi:hypothetical protein
VATNNIQIHGVDFDWKFEHHVGGATCSVFNGFQVRFTGTLTGGVFNPANRSITFTNAEIDSHPGAGVGNLTLRGIFSPTGALTVLD